MNTLTFKVYESTGGTLVELGTVLHEVTLIKMAKMLNKKEVERFYIESYRNGQPVSDKHCLTCWK